MYDISYLFRKIALILETISICVIDDEIHNVTHLEYDPHKYDIFSYTEDLKTLFSV